MNLILKFLSQVSLKKMIFKTWVKKLLGSISITTSVSTIHSPLSSLMHGQRHVFSKTSRPRLSRAIAKLCICLLNSQDIYGPRATRFESFSKKSVNMCHLNFCKRSILIHKLYNIKKRCVQELLIYRVCLFKSEKG